MKKLPEPADLEFTLRRRDEKRYNVELVFRSPESDADIRPLGQQEVTVTFDQQRLLQASINSEEYGFALSEMLFDSPALARGLAEARASAQSQRLPLRFRLAVAPDAPELHSLRWETLRDPKDGRPLAISEQLLFTRTIGSSDWRPITLRAKGHLSTLICIAAPKGLDGYNLHPIDVVEEQERAATNLSVFQASTLTTPDVVSIDTIISTLRNGVDILYLLAHGRLIDGEPWLFLDNGQGTAKPILGAELAARIAGLPTPPRLIVLASCQSADETGHEPLAALGPRLAVSGIAAVVAMQSRLSIETNAVFAPVLFRELGHHGRVDWALAIARQAIADKSDWWAPTLFTRLRSGRIWYEPGFDEQQDGQRDFNHWPALLGSISNGKCTPILGPGLLDSIAGSTREIAEQLAEKHKFPLAPFARDDLPQVAQFIAVNQSIAHMRDEVAGALRRALRKRMPAVQSPLSKSSLIEVLSTAGNQWRKNSAIEPHLVLASLRLPIYLTANSDSLMSDALASVGCEPQVIICPWHLKGKHHSQEEIDPPDINRPLVYHLLGHLSDPDSLVITEDDYFRYLIGVQSNEELIPTEVQRSLADTALLFLGFRFEDWSFRALLQSLLQLEGRERRSNYAHVAVQIDPQEGATMNPQAARKYLKTYLGSATAQAHGATISVYWGSAEDFIRELHLRWKEHLLMEAEL